MDRYQQTVVAGAFDPLAVVSTLVDSGLLTSYVVYERDQCWHVAGNPLGEVIVDASLVRSTFGGDVTVEPWSGTPWPRVRAALDRASVTDWHAYGWACFELGSAGGIGSAEPLAHLIVPGVELRVSAQQVLIRSVDPAVLAAVRTAVSRPARVETREPSPVDINVGRQSYVDGVARAVARIQQGHLQKVILSRSVDVPFPVDMRATYLLGRAHNTPARSFLLDLGGWQAAGFSPETVVEVRAGGAASTQPLAGTRARTGDPAADHALRTALLADPKEIFEHATSVKLAFDELDTVGRPATTRVSEFLAVKPRGSVQHLASRVDTTLAEARTAWDAFGALFPAVTGSGIPKAPAYRLITELEDTPRALYAGAVLMSGADGTLDAALVLRAIYQHHGRAWLRAGAGVVAASRPEREYEETCEKLRSIAPYVVAAGSDQFRTAVRVPVTTAEAE